MLDQYTLILIIEFYFIILIKVIVKVKIKIVIKFLLYQYYMELDKELIYLDAMQVYEMEKMD